MVLQGLFAFARARALQAPLTFLGISGLAAWYGVYDLAYLATATAVGRSADKSLGCRMGGHAAGCALGATVLALRFPRAALSQAVSRGHLMAAPWSDAALVVASSAGVGGAAGAVAQRVIGRQKR